MPFLALLAISLLCLIAIVRLFPNWFNQERDGNKKELDVCVYAISAVLLVAHLIAAYQTRFLGSWDNGGLYTAAWNVVHNWTGIPFAPESWNEYFTKDLLSQYFSTYPNNGFLVALMIATMDALAFIGIDGFSAALLVFTCLNSLLYAIAGILLYDTLKTRCTQPVSFLGFIFFVALVGLSPWFLVAYSDSLVVAIPIAICWIATKIENQPIARTYPKLGAMAFIGLIGYFIKPQIIFIALAALLIYVFPCLVSTMKSRRANELVPMVTSLLAGIAIAFLVKGAASHMVNNSFEIDENQSFSAAHFFMMGLNDETNGGFCAEDVFFSQSFSNTAERNAADISRALERISEKGTRGITLHILKKQLALWGDSSFGWDQEGELAGTYAIVLKDSPSPFSPYLAADLETNGQVTSTPYGTVIQIVWLMTVLSLLATIRIDSNRRFAAMLMISILCLGIFEICFEVRSRYLFAYLPTIILLACMALNSIRSNPRSTKREGAAWKKTQ